MTQNIKGRGRTCQCYVSACAARGSWILIHILPFLRIAQKIRFDKKNNPPFFSYFLLFMIDFVYFISDHIYFYFIYFSQLFLLI